MEQLFNLFYETTGVSTDTRNITENSLFIALKGANFNGNEFAEDALSKGAKYAIVDENKYANNTTIFAVDNALFFLQRLANHHRNKFDFPVIAITGSNGKTTTKELIANVLTQSFQVLYTKGNLNNHIGVPLTLLELNATHDIALIEMGANKPGDIKELVDIADPTHGIITNIGLAHIEGFGSADGVKKTKKELYDHIFTNNGVLFYNGDDKLLSGIIPNTESYTYGTNASCVIKGALIKLTPEVVFNWSSNTYSSTELKTHIIGEYNFYNILAAVSIGNYFGMEPELINQGITSYSSTNNRSQVLHTDRNTVILDAYNANPTSVEAALISFSKMEYENKLVVLGDMMELGAISDQSHRKIIELVRSFQLEAIFVGKIYSTLKDDYPSYMFLESADDAKQFLGLAKPSKNLILLKGSRSVGLETLADIF